MRSFSYSRGKQRELDRYQAGRGSVVLLNSDRKYDPSISNQLTVNFSTFENGQNGNLIDSAWLDVGDDLYGQPSTLSVTNTQAHSGTYSLEVENDDPGDFLGQIEYGPVSLRSNQIYTFSAYVKVAGPNAMLFQPSVFYFDDEMNDLDDALGAEFEVEVADGWTQIWMHVAPLEGAAFTFLDIFAGDLGMDPAHWFVDDIDFHEGTYLTFGGAGVLSPYHPNIKPQKRIRIPVTYAGTTHYLIEGYIDSWDQVRRGPHTGETVVNFTDGFKLLNKAGLESSAYAQEVTFDSPIAWWRLGEPETVNTAYDQTENNNHAEYLDSPNRGETGLVSRDAGTSTEFVHDQPNRVERVGNILTEYPFTIEAVLNIPVAADDEFRVIYDEEYDSTTLTGMTLYLDDDSDSRPGQLTWSLAVGGVTQRKVYSTSRVDDGETHHVALVASSSTSTLLYVDGVDVTNIADAGTATLPTSQYRTAIGNLPAFSTDVGQFGLSGFLQEVAVYEVALSAAQIATHAESVSTPWNNDTPAERVTRVLDHVEWSSTRRDLDTGASVLQSADIANSSALEHIQKVGDSEFGKLFIDKHGNVRLISRENQWNRTPVATFTDDDDYQSSDPEYTDELIRNDVTVSRAEGKAQKVKDATSIADYFLNSYTADGLIHNDDDLSLSAAQYIVDIYKDPLLRISSVSITPQGNPSVLFPILLGLELGDWVVIEETPQDVGSTTVHTAVVEGISLNWSPKEWVFTLNLSPADTRSFWLAGVDGYSNAGVSTRAGF